MGSFQHALPLNTQVFSDTFEALPALLRGVPKHTRVLTFCTGGIRCVKVNAYLSQRLGYSNTASLQDGIVGYKRWLVSTGARNTESATTATSATTASVSAIPGAGNGVIVKGDEAVGDMAVASLFHGENYVFDRRRVQHMGPNSAPGTGSDGWGQ